jgi:CubicO group peptidase (beta-lactamase class C family)
VRTLSVFPTVLLAWCVLSAVPAAQAPPSPSFSLFERYLDSLRQQTGIPGLSAAIVQGRKVIWERGFGQRDIETNQPALPDTPYPIGGLTQSFGAVALGQCIERGTLDVDAPVDRWAPALPAGVTVRQLLSHSSTGTFQYDASRFAALTAVADDCGDQPFRPRVTTDVLERLGMADSAPGTDLVAPPEPVRAQFQAEQLARFGRVLDRMASPYRVSAGRATRTDFQPRGVDVATGLVSTVRDLARFEAALDDSGVLLRADYLAAARARTTAPSGQPLPTGLGWFVQDYNGQPVVWQFSAMTDAYSGLLLKVPTRDLTLVLLANSDGLSASFDLERGDVTRSAFAALFLRLFAL